MKEFLEYAKSKGVKEIDVDTICLLSDFFKETKNKQFVITDVVASNRDETLELLEEIMVKVKEADSEVENGIYDPMLECAKHILNNYKIERR